MVNLNVAPRWLSAKTKDELTALVLAYQTKHGVGIKLINILQDSKGEWVAWFTDVDRDPKNLTNVILRKAAP